MANFKMKKEGYLPETNCYLCKKPALVRDHPDPRKDFICSMCTLVLSNHPRTSGERWDDIIPKEKKTVDVDLQKELSDILKI